MRIVLPIVLAASLLLARSHARADEAPRADAHLEYRAPGGCPGEIEFSSEVSVRLRYTPWREGASQRIAVTIAHTDLGFVAVLTAHDSVRTTTADRCDALVDNLATTVAELIDPGMLAPFAWRLPAAVDGAPAPSVVTLAPIAAPVTPELELTRRWHSRTPWKVAGAGVLSVGLGAIAYAASERDAQQFNDAIEANCSVDPCSSDELADVLWYQNARATMRRANVEHGLAIGLFVGGGAAVVTGLVMAALNRPRITERAKVVVAPTAGGATVAVAGGF